MADTTDERLLLLIQRIERLLEERSGITADIREVYAEGKAVGYDPRMMRKLIARRAMRPDDRAEADVLLGVYEAAVGMGDGAETRTIADMRPDAAAIALDMITADIVMLEDAEQARRLVEHVLHLLDLRAEIRLLRQQESERRKLAKAEGFDDKQLAVTVRWFEKCAKHGEQAMRAGEATFQLYRGTVESARGAEAAQGVTQDEKLAALFQPAPPPKAKAISKTVSRLAAQAAAARRAIGEGE